MKKLKLIAFLITCVVSQYAIANNNDQLTLEYSINSSWNKPQFRQYTSINKNLETSYQKQNATLIIIESLCPQCKHVTQEQVNQLNNNTANGITAALIKVAGNNAIYQLSSSRKGVDLRQLRFFHNGRFYEIQLGVNRSAKKSELIKLEREFLMLVSSIRIKD